MFRALALLILLAGTPQIDHSETLPAEDFLEVQNFQIITSSAEETTNLITAKAALAIDLDTQMSLFEKAPDLRLPIASLAKLMTALVILDENQLNEIVTVSAEANQTEGSRIWLYPGEQITVENLIKGMLIQSGNDAAYELAKYNASTLNAFSQKMNQKAFYLGLQNSHFLDPAGLDDVNNFSTAKDLALIAKHLLKHDFIRKIVATRVTSVFSTDGKLEHKLENTNKMLELIWGAKGLKTGTTEIAKQCLITLLDIQGNEILIIILGSEDRYQDTEKILEYLQTSS